MYNFAAIPLELQKCPQWVLWCSETRDNGKPTKVPYAVNGSMASVTDKTSWNTFDAACSAFNAGGYSGIGFVFTADDPYAGIDIDDARGDQAQLAAHRHVIAAFPSYAELSPSGLGLHIIVRGRINGARRHGVEAYSDGRYFTFTGNVWRDAPILDCQPMLDELQRDLQPARMRPVLISTEGQYEDDNAIVSRMLSAANGNKAQALANGDGSLIAGSDRSGSAVDMALVNVIQFYTKNVEQIERIWVSTPHGQNPARAKKLARRDYRLRTIGLAFDRTPDTAAVDFSELQKQWAAVPPDSENDSPRLVADNNDTASTAPNVSGRGTATKQAPLTGHKHKAAAPVNPFRLPSGLMGEIANYIYMSAPRQVHEIALAGAIGWMAGVAGKAYNISGVGLNMYLVLLASSGTGKEAISQGFSDIEQALIAAKAPAISGFMGAGNFASVPGFLRYIVDNPSVVSVIGEFGMWLNDLIGPKAAPVRQALKGVLVDLFSKSGKRGVYRTTAYGDKENNIVEIKSSAFSLLGEGTPSTFYRNISDASIEDGFLPRFVIIEYEGPAPYVNHDAAYARLDPRLVERLASFVKQCSQLNMLTYETKGDSTLITQLGPHDVQAESDVAEIMRKFSEYCTDRSNAHGITEGLKNLWSRVYINVAKLAALVAVGNNYLHPVITMADYDWAHQLVMHSTNKIIRKISTGEVGSSREATQWAKLITCLHEVRNYNDKLAHSYKLNAHMVKDGVVNIGWLGARVSRLDAYASDPVGSTRAKDRVLARAVAEGLLTLYPAYDKRSNLGGMCYQINVEALLSHLPKD